MRTSQIEPRPGVSPAGDQLFLGGQPQADTVQAQTGSNSLNESEQNQGNDLANDKSVVLSSQTTALSSSAKQPASSASSPAPAAGSKAATEVTNPQQSFDNAAVHAKLNQTSYNPQEGQAIQLTAKIVAQAGDQVNFIIPQGAYQVSYQNSELSGSAGTTSSKTLADGSTVITDAFTTSGTYTQTFSLQPYTYELNLPYLLSAGTTLVPIIIQKNDQEMGRVSFNQTIISTMKPTFERTQPSWQSVGKLAPNVDYQWTLTFNENPGTTTNAGRTNGPAKSINHGTTVTIPVPQGFVLNKEASENLSKTGFGDMHWTASQADGAGGVVTFVSQGHDNSFTEIVLVGHFINQLADQAQKLTAQGQIQIVQDTGNGTQLKASLPPFSDQLMSKSEDNPQGVTYIGSVHVAYGESGEKYPQGQVPLSKNPETISFWKYQVGNASAFNKTDVPVKITLPDGMKATKLVLPTSYNSGQIKYTLHRYLDASHPDETTTGVLNPGQTSLDFSNLTGNVRTIELTLVSLNSGLDYTANNYSTSDGFRVYGYVSQQYDNETAVKVGDKLTSYLYIGGGDKGWSDVQQVVAKKTQPVNLIMNSYQSNRTPGTQASGNLGVGWVDASQNQDFANPVIYYVLPTNADFNQYMSVNHKAQVSSYKASDGRTIVKVVYDQARNQDFPYYSYDYLTLNNAADLPYSSSDYKIFMVLPDGMQVKGKDKLSAADLKYVENNQDAYEIGHGNWVTESAKGTQIVEQSQGNKNLDLTLSGESDNLGSDKMTFTGSVMNNTDNDLKNVVYELNLPDTADPQSGFNFYLNGPVKVVDAVTGKAVDGVQVKYSSSRLVLSQNAKPTGGDFGGLPTDLKQVRAVQVVLPSLAVGQSVRVVLNGFDPTILSDPEKTAYLSSSLYTSDDSLKPITILPNMASASSIKVTGVPSKVVSESKTVTETIHYVYGSDQAKSGQAAPDHQVELIFTRQGVENLNDGTTKWGSWTPASQEFAAVTSPNIEGYRPDQAQIDPQTVTEDSSDLEMTVTYTAIPVEPVSPEKPQVNPEKPVKPLPAKPDNQAPQKPVTVKTGNGPVEKTSQPATGSQLPQTGNETDNKAGLLGLSFASLAGFLGFSAFKKRRN